MPGYRRLFGLLHQASQVDLRRPQEFGVPGLDEGGQQDIERTIIAGCQNDPVQNRIGPRQGLNWGTLFIVLAEKGQIRGRDAEPGERNLESGSQ